MSLPAGGCAFVGGVFFAIRGAGQNRAGCLTENADRIAFVDRYQHPLIDDGVAFSVQKNQIGGAETAAGEDDCGRVCNCRVRNF